MTFVMCQVLSDLDELHGCHSGHELLSYLRLCHQKKQESRLKSPSATSLGNSTTSLAKESRSFNREVAMQQGD